MKVGTVKKLIILADGFAYNNSLEIFYSQGSTWTHFKYIRQWEFYPILLHRAVEGWNENNGPYDISINYDYIEYYGKLDTRIIKNHLNYTKTDYLAAQEQAIEACLIELLEKKRIKE